MAFSSSFTNDFDKFFLSIFGFSLLKRKSQSSVIELIEQKYLWPTIGAVFLSICSIFVMLSKCLTDPDSKLSELSELGASVSYYILGWYRGVNLLLNREKVNKLLGDLNNYFQAAKHNYPRGILDDHSQNTARNNEIIRRFYFFGLSAWLVIPIGQSSLEWIFKDQKYVHRYPMNAWTPFDEEQFFAFVCAYAFQMATSLGVILFMFCEDILFQTSVNQLRMHLRYTGIWLSRMDVQRDSEIQELKALIRQQYAFKRLKKDIEGSFGLSTFIGFNIVKMAVCVSVFLLVHDIDGINLLRFTVGVVSLLVPAFLRCSNGSGLYSDSANLIYCMYDQNWWEGTLSYRKILVIMMQNSNAPMKLEATQFKHITIEYFKEIVQQAYSLLMFFYNFSK